MFDFYNLHSDPSVLYGYDQYDKFYVMTQMGAYIINRLADNATRNPKTLDAVKWLKKHQTQKLAQFLNMSRSSVDISDTIGDMYKVLHNYNNAYSHEPAFTPESDKLILSYHDKKHPVVVDYLIDVRRGERLPHLEPLIEQLDAELIIMYAIYNVEGEWGPATEMMENFIENSNANDFSSARMYNMVTKYLKRCGKRFPQIEQHLINFPNIMINYHYLVNGFATSAELESRLLEAVKKFHGKEGEFEAHSAVVNYCRYFKNAQWPEYEKLLQELLDADDWFITEYKRYTSPDQLKQSKPRPGSIYRLEFM